MLFATRLRLFSFRFLVPLLLLAGLGSSCQSSRASFSFQPTPNQAQPAPAQASPASAGSANAPATASVPATAVPEATAKHVVGLGHRPDRLIPRVAVATEKPRAAPSFTIGSRGVHRRPPLGRAHAPAEAGLGTTVLGVLGLVVLPIALIGLAISGGGLVWGVVAGAAALAVLVAYIDQFGG